MSERIAKTHHNTSNRARAQESSADRRVVYKSVLDSPFKLQWPNVATNIQNTLIARVVAMLEGVAEFQLAHQAVQRKRKREEHKARREKKKLRKMGADGQPDDVQDAIDSKAAEGPAECSSGQPPILQHVVVGINQVTKDLEGLSKSFRETITAEDSTTPASQADVRARLVLVCREDVDPPILIAHLPNLVAACNSTRHRLSHAAVTWLVPLSKGSESTLAAAMGLRRASIMVIKDSAAGFSELRSLLESVPILSASWLEPPTTTQQHTRSLVPTHIKLLRTTAPKDMKAAKEKRTRERALAKERKKAAMKKKHVWKPMEIPRRTTYNFVLG